MTGRDTISLDGEWRFAPDPYGHGADHGYWRADCDDVWTVAPVPSCFEAASENLEFYKGICWYRRHLRVPNTWKGKRIVLRFEAVNYRARVWLNGELLGENRDGFLPFEFDVTDKVSAGGSCVIAVQVDNRHHEGDLPGMHTGWRRFGGITREVSLYATSQCYVSRVQVFASPSKTGGDAEFRLEVTNRAPQEREVSLPVAVRDAGNRAKATFESERRVLKAGARETILLGVSVDKAQPWSPQSPALYRATVSLSADGQDLDEVDVCFGFRTIEATKTGLLLNGQPIRLRGFNRHEDSPRAGMAADHEMARKDLLEMKEAGANFVRLCHYPHHPGTLDMCDELGLLAFAEIPLYFWRDEDEGRRTQPARAAAAARQLERMIARDFNHPSVIFWSVSNETDTRREDVRRDNEELIRRARALDPTRLCVHVSNKPDIAPFFDEEHVICVNRYPCMGLAKRGAVSAADLEKGAARWRSDLANLHERYPDKPILITEFGYVSFDGTRGMPHGEDVHARVLEIEYAAMQAPYVCGAAIWCWADHAWPNRTKNSFLGELMISPYGVVTRDRRKLKPYWAARALFTGAGQPVGEKDP